jgi:hypothetical protein
MYACGHPYDLTLLQGIHHNNESWRVLSVLFAEYSIFAIRQA